MAEHFDVNDIQGLTEAEAARRLQDEGLNELPSTKRRSILAIVFEVVREPMFLLLVACGTLYLVLGDLQEALMLMGFVLVVMGITVYQERRTERALEALRDLSSPRALVIRDGHQKRIAGREVARGDMIILVEGDRVPADAVLRQALNLSADESLLTGESMVVRKVAADDTNPSPSQGEVPASAGGEGVVGRRSPAKTTTPSPDPAGHPLPERERGETATAMTMARPGGDDLPFVYSGTLITRGQGLAEVLATGLKSEIGKIGKALQSVEPEQTLLQKETGRLVRNLAIVGLSLCAVVVVVYGLTRGNNTAAWQQGLLAGIAMAMATLPEEFPVVLTIFLALGAWRISQSRVLTRRIPAIETLGAATVLCVDKTGTLTQNKMSIGKLFAKGRHFTVANPSPSQGEVPASAGGEGAVGRRSPAYSTTPSPGPAGHPLPERERGYNNDNDRKNLPEDFHELLEFGILASKRDPFDPMDKALKELGATFLTRTEHLHDNWVLVHEYPLSPHLLALSHVWKSPDGRDFVIAAKGAPEAIGDLCHLAPEELQAMSAQTQAMAGEGLRVLGVAKAYFKKTDLPEGQHDFKFKFIGLVGLADPVRPTVPAAIQECYTAGIRVIMITGDYPATAQKIGREIGLRNCDQTITGPELDGLSDEQLQQRIPDVNIFARVVPEQKLRIVQALKANHEIVAMTGDGVNDAPALKAAHIGIAMGGRGTDVARESSALVLLDDDFSSIVRSVRLGRRIFDNIKKAISYIFAIHVPIAGLSLIPVFFVDWKLILLPVHIVFLELIIDPACSVVFEAEEAEADVMTRPPRRPQERLFSLKSIAVSLLQGFSVLGIVLAVFLYGKSLPGHDENTARALTFTALVVANLGLILTNRSWSRTIISMFRMPNQALWWVLGGAMLFLGLVLYVPALRDLFHFGVLHADDLILCLLAGVTSILWFEVLKVLKGRGRRASR